MNSVEVEINDFEIVNDPDIDLRNGIQKLFDGIIEKDNRTSEFKRKCRIWKRNVVDLCNDCAESVFRCYEFGRNEVIQMSFQVKEKYSEQVNGNFEQEFADNGAPDIEMGLDSTDDMRRT